LFVLGLQLPVETVVDLGSGNGRDTYALAAGYHAIGIDPGTLPEDAGSAQFHMKPWKDALDIIRTSDLVYSRFFLHAVPDTDIDMIVANTPKYFAAEARAIGDEPKVYPEHERHFVDGNELLYTLAANGFEILHFEKRRGLAPYKDEDPLLVRVVAKKTCD